MGIPTELQVHLFEQFTSAGRQGTQGESTTGLGLYIARQIVEQHQGKLWLESEENKGTTFFIELPAKPWAGMRYLSLYGHGLYFQPLF